MTYLLLALAIGMVIGILTERAVKHISHEVALDELTAMELDRDRWKDIAQVAMRTLQEMDEMQHIEQMACMARANQPFSNN